MPVLFTTSGIFARFAGQLCVALGFILGIYGLTEGQPAIMNTGLALLVVGVIASAYGLYTWVRHLHPPAPGAPRRAPSRWGASDNDAGTNSQ